MQGTGPAQVSRGMLCVSSISCFIVNRSKLSADVSIRVDHAAQVALTCLDLLRRGQVREMPFLCRYE